VNQHADRCGLGPHRQHRVEAFVLGTLPPEERAAFESHLPDCDACHTDVSVLAPVGDALHHAADPVEPPASLKARLMAGLEPLEPPDPLYADAGGEWAETPFPGVTFRTLFVDPVQRRHTVLVKMAAGSEYPRHGHQGPEECYLLRGDMFDGSIQMHAGDYTRLGVGSEHGPLTTKGGCEFLVMASLDDTIL